MEYFIASHISDLYGPTEEIIRYLKNHHNRFVAVLNPLEYCQKAKRHVIFYDGNNENIIKLFNIHNPAILSWLIDFGFVIWFGLKQQKINYFIACDPLNGLAGVILKKFKIINNHILYTVDWSVARFPNKLINRIYHLLDKYCAKNTDMNWCVTHRLVDMRSKQGVSLDKLKYVPIGIYANKPLFKDINDKYALVFLGALEKTKGIQLIIDSWQILKKKIPNVSLHIVGISPQGKFTYEKVLKKLPGVYLHGLKDHNQVLKILVQMGIGLAPYENSVNSISYYADPSRIKDYLTCSLPVITTNTAEISQLIKNNKAGIIINYSVGSLINAIEDIIRTNNYNNYKRNSFILAKKFSWDKILNKAFKI